MRGPDLPLVPHAARVAATAAETREVETWTIEQAGIPVEVLMERAALGVAAVAAQQARSGIEGRTREPIPIALLAGPGHNGADAAACARILATWGFEPTVFATAGKRAPLTERQLASASAYGVAVRPLSEFRSARVVIDGLLGFGLDRAPAGEIADAIARINDPDQGIVIAIDLPSGTHADTGMPPGERVNATHTVACGLLKLGIACDPAVDAVGEVWLADLGYPAPYLDSVAGRILHSEPPPARQPSSHKGSSGTALVIGGSAAMSGAPALMAQAAYRAGAGLVIACVPGSIRDVVAALVPEALVVPLPEQDGHAAPESLEAIRPYLARATAVALGPGLGRTAGAGRLVRGLWEVWDGPLLVDADGLLPELAGCPRPGPTVLTPHPGEAGRLLGVSSGAIQADRRVGALEIARTYAATAVLKGARTIVAQPDGQYAVLLRTTSALATAGSGDVLTGLIAGLLARGIPPDRAAERGVALHADLGLDAAPGGQRGALMARDLLDCSRNFRQLPRGPVRAGSSAIRLT